MFRKIAQSNLTAKQREVNQIKSDILNDFNDTPSFETVNINGVSKEVHIITNKENNKIMLSKPGDIFSVGDIVNWNSMKFLIVDIDENQQIQTKGTIQLCTNTLNLYQIGNLYQIPCVILDRQNINTSEDKYLTTIDCDILVLIANTETNMLISSNDIFKIGIWNYYVTKPDDITKQGLIIVPMKFSEQEQTIPNYSLIILNGDLINLQQGNTIQLNIEVKDGTIILTPPPLYLFISSDENILTVNSNGLVTGISVGTVTVTCKLQSDETIYDTISITVEEVPIADNFSVSISGLTTVKLNSNITLTANVLNNGVVDITKSVIWSLTNQDGSSNQYVSIVSQDGSSIVLKATGNISYINKYVVVRASKSDDVNVYDEHILQIKNIF